MKEKHFRSFFTLHLLFFLTSHSFSIGINQIVSTKVWSMEQSTDSLLQEGLAGSFFGKQNDWFILAGGANFPHDKPWQDGTKTFYDNIFVFLESNSNEFQLVNNSNKLPFALAEGAYVSTSKGLLCIGGQTEKELSNKTFLINYNGENVEVEMLPDLPIALKNGAAALIDNLVYFLGGQDATGLSVPHFLILNLNDIDKGWQSLPNFPLPISATTMSAQQDGKEISLFVFGGRATHPQTNITTFYSSVYNFSPTKNIWTKRNNIQIKKNSPFHLSMVASAPLHLS